MNNINIKSKKTKVLNSFKFLEIENKYDPFYANIYSLMSNKRTNDYSKMELKRMLAKMYDSHLSITSNIKGNIVYIRYTITAIQDKYLPTSIENEISALYDSIHQTRDFTDQEIESSAREIGLYISNYFDNKQNIANNLLNYNIDEGEMKLTQAQMLEFYQNPDIDAIKKWITKLEDSEFVTLNFNSGKEQVDYQHTNFDYKIDSLKVCDDQTTYMNLDQAYVSIGYKINSNNMTAINLANLILGGGVYSKLFKIIREEHSLSYNIRSSLSSENLIMISGGLNNDKLELFSNELETIVKNIKVGGFEQEFELAKTSYIENIKKSKSSEMAYINMYVSGYLKDDHKTHDQIIENIQKVTYDQVLEVFKGMTKLAQVIVK